MAPGASPHRSSLLETERWLLLLQARQVSRPPWSWPLLGCPPSPSTSVCRAPSPAQPSTLHSAPVQVPEDQPTPLAVRSLSSAQETSSSPCRASCWLLGTRRYGTQPCWPPGAHSLQGRWTGAPECGTKQGGQRGLGLGWAGGLWLLSTSPLPEESKPQGLFVFLRLF